MAQTVEEYVNVRKDLVYYRVARRIIKILSGNKKTILDVGSAGIDLMSDVNFKERYSISLFGAINNEKVTGYEMDFFNYKPDKKFDIVTCMQVIEHIKDARLFTQKLLQTGNVTLISLPYKWRKGKTKSHVQDPVDEDKILSWTDIKPLYSFYVADGGCQRIICIYGKLNLIARLKLFFLSKKYTKEYSNALAIKNVSNKNAKKEKH